jgi:single-strand DNA-binding protein
MVVCAWAFGYGDADLMVLQSLNAGKRKGAVMAGSVNKVILVGNLGADPEIRSTNAGKPIANLSVATSESWKDRNTGERREKTEWHRVVIFNEGLTRIAEQYLKKGSKVYLEGQLQTRKWQDQSGADRYSTEVVLQGFNSTLTMLDSRAEGGGSYGAQAGGGDFGQSSPMDGGSGGGTGGGPGGGQGQAPAQNFSQDLDDEVPF